MSWRLEDRDLNGSWIFRSDEKELIDQIFTEALRDPLSEYHEQLSTSLSQSFEKLNRDHHAEVSVYTRALVQNLTDWIAQAGKVWDQRRRAEQSSSSPSLPSDLTGLISERLKVVADLVPSGWALVDIGTDHGLLPIALIKSGRVPVALGIDIAPKPLKIAQRHLDESEVHGQLALVCGDGIRPLIPASERVEWIESWSDSHAELWDEARRTRRVAVTICGVGGHVASQKISELPEWVSMVIVQANNDPAAVDHALAHFQRSISTSSDQNVEPARLAPPGLWEMFTHPETTLSVTLDRRRLFITKSAQRSFADTPMSSRSHSTSDDDSALTINALTQDSDAWLWYWVQLSRHLKVLTLTPRGHPSRSWKCAHVIDALTLWLTLYADRSAQA